MRLFKISLCILAMIWSLTAWQVDASLLILQFTSQTPLQTFPDVSIESVENGTISPCFDAQVMTNTQNTVWTVECQLTNDQDISLGFTVHLSEAFSGTVSTISQGQNASSGQQNSISETTPKNVSDEPSQEEEIQEQIDLEEAITDSVEIADESEAWISPQITSLDRSNTNTAVTYQSDYGPLCRVQGIAICERPSEDGFMSFHRHLSCSEIVKYQSGCIAAECEKLALRQEVAGIAMKLGRHQAVSEKLYTRPFSDVIYGSDWTAQAIETGLKNGYISSDNLLFRPKESITRAEAFGMLMKSVCLSMEDSGDNWHEDVYNTAQQNNLTIRTYEQFMADQMILRQEVFVVASRLLDYVNATGGCYARLSCQ